MTPFEFAVAIINALVIIAGYLLRLQVTEIKDEIKETKQTAAHAYDQLQDVKVNYLHRDDFKDFKLELRSMFEEIKTDVKALKVK